METLEYLEFDLDDSALRAMHARVAAIVGRLRRSGNYLDIVFVETLSAYAFAPKEGMPLLLRPDWIDELFTVQPKPSRQPPPVPAS
jgi:hypothetical protein